jgi:hypothetical protein
MERLIDDNHGKYFLRSKEVKPCLVFGPVFFRYDCKDGKQEFVDKLIKQIKQRGE